MAVRGTSCLRDTSVADEIRMGSSSPGTQFCQGADHPVVHDNVHELLQLEHERTRDDDRMDPPMSTRRQRVSIDCPSCVASTGPKHVRFPKFPWQSQRSGHIRTLRRNTTRDITTPCRMYCANSSAFLGTCLRRITAARASRRRPAAALQHDRSTHRRCHRGCEVR